MKRSYFFAVLTWCLFTMGGCDDDESSGEFTGRFTTYQLVPGSGQNVKGTIMFREKTDHSTQIIIYMTPTGESLLHPAHLHYGTMVPEAEMAAMLHPVDGATGKSVTDLSTLMDDTPMAYGDLLDFDGHIKVHLDDGPNKDVIIAYSDIGKNNDAPIDQKE